ncbi:MAG: hypothetical protein E6G86_07295 [Alphaproteobacteria bacterium]|nr:MAG: hypothetical protein E6G86_07295 [Alphaproteobacteria bacterium]
MTSWPDLIFEKLREFGIRHVAYVPDAGLARLIELCQAADDMEPTVLTTEEEGIGILAGAWLGGERGALLMQSSGVGNCINALSLAKVCGFPLLMIVTMRGEWGEMNPWQIPMGQITGKTLQLAGVIVYEVTKPEAAAPTVEAKLPRRAAIAQILAERQDTLVVTGLGSPTYDCAAVGDHPLNFYLWGAMGSAVTVGLGLALAQPKRRVLVVTGDGEMLMGLGALATVAMKGPNNLSILVIDNEHYGETGMQQTHTSAGVDLAGIALRCGFPQSVTVRQQAELDNAASILYMAKGPVVVVLKVSSARDPLVLPPWDGALLKSRFRQAVLGPQVF